MKNDGRIFEAPPASMLHAPHSTTLLVGISTIFPVFLGFPFRLFLGGDGSMSMFASEGRCLFRGRVVASVFHESVLPTGVSTTLCGAFPDAKLGVGRG